MERGRFTDEVAGGAGRWATAEHRAEMCVPSTESFANDVQEPSAKRLRARIERGEQRAETTAVEREHRRELGCTDARGVLAAREQRQLPEDVAGPYLCQLNLALAGPARRDGQAARLDEVQCAAGFSLGQRSSPGANSIRRSSSASEDTMSDGRSANSGAAASAAAGSDFEIMQFRLHAAVVSRRDYERVLGTSSQVDASAVIGSEATSSELVTSAPRIAQAPPRSAYSPPRVYQSVT